MERAHQVVSLEGHMVDRTRVEATKEEFGEILGRQDPTYLVPFIHNGQRETMVFLQKASSLQKWLVEGNRKRFALHDVTHLQIHVLHLFGRFDVKALQDEAHLGLQFPLPGSDSSRFSSQLE